ncbi:serine/threonine-protein kinase PLK4-like isoform X2 [Octopus vulgaris]|uniref:Serine/threonine-protein kinase PLK4 n=1 Tax=Octopus vulgaris TaxID=6645 RepID=A0AA36BHG5_OCTVU|nr:serine/threonine-protein kinase PLK4-like isoform X2 [Octopus vulgaris]
MADPYSFGDKIEDYNVLNLLGKGGFACVYRAKCMRTGQDVAIKMIDKKLMKAADMVTRVRKEVEIHSRMKHPAVLELYTYFEDKNYVYLVLELCHRGELHRYLKAYNKVLSEEEAVVFMDQIISGMIYLHSHNILHRDLTLANLLLTREMDVKIADFGLATQLQMPDEKHFTMCGTPNYISPEVAMRTSHGLEADVWSLGCMLYTFLVGNPPFDTEAVKSTLNRVIMVEYDLPNYLSPEAKDLIQLLLRKDPKERIALSEIPDHPFMKKRYPLSYRHRCHQNCHEASIDSGKGTMNTETNSWSRNISHSTNGSRSRPLLGLPIQEIQSYISEKDDYSSEFFPENTNVFPHKFQQGKYLDIHPAAISASSTQHHNRTNPKVGIQPAFHHGSSTKPPLQLESHQHKVLLNKNHIPNSYNHQISRHDCNYNKSNNVLWDRPFHEMADCNVDPSKIPVNSKSTCSLSCSGSLCSNNANLLSSDPSSSSQPNLSDQSSSNSLHMQPGVGIASDTSSEGSSPDIALRKEGHVGTLSKMAFGKNTKLKEEPTLSLKKRECAGEDCDSGLKTANSSNQIKYSTSVSNDPTTKITTSSKNRSSHNAELPPSAISALSSIRLRPIRQRTKTAFVSILDSGDVCLEFVKNRSKEEYIAEIFLISQDGHNVTIYQANNGQKFDPNQVPPPHSANVIKKTFHLQSLPEKYLKKYQYASKFVNLVRSKTPKVTLYTTKAKCMLMENYPEPDFEVDFYDGAKFTISSSGIRIIENNGTSLLLESGETGQCFSSETQKLLAYVKDCRQRCIELEQVISTVELSCKTVDNLFPIIIGRKPNVLVANAKTDDHDIVKSAKDSTGPTIVPSEHPTDVEGSLDGTYANSPLITTQNSTCNSSLHRKSSFNRPASPSVTTDLTSSASSNHSSCNNSSHSNTHSNRIVRQIFVPNVGWSFQYMNGEIWIKFNDGTQLGVKPSGQTFKYVDVDCKMAKYQKTDVLPGFVKKKLETVPFVVKSLLSDNRMPEIP